MLFIIIVVIYFLFYYFLLLRTFSDAACLGQSLKEMCQPTRRDSVLDQIEEDLGGMEGNVNSEEKRPSSPVIPENGISWRIQSPPNRRADDLDGSGNFANNNGKGIKEEDSILVDDPVTPWREDVYEDLINSINKPNIARVLETSVSQKVGQKRNMQRNKKRNKLDAAQNLGKGRKKVPQQNAKSPI